MKKENKRERWAGEKHRRWRGIKTEKKIREDTGIKKEKGNRKMERKTHEKQEENALEEKIQIRETESHRENTDIEKESRKTKNGKQNTGNEKRRALEEVIKLERKEEQSDHINWKQEKKEKKNRQKRNAQVIGYQMKIKWNRAIKVRENIEKVE